MKNVQPDMNVAKQRRKVFALHDRAEGCPTDDALIRIRYVNYLLHLFDGAVLDGQPQPASQFIPMYEEEFG